MDPQGEQQTNADEKTAPAVLPQNPAMGQPGYPAAGQPGYPATGQPGYPAAGQPGYPITGQPGYPATGNPVMYNPAMNPQMMNPNMPMGQPMMGQQMMGQPMVQWMAKPEAILGCPSGLEYLTQIDQVIVNQVMELLEMMTNWETQNRYIIRNTLGQQIYYAHEESDTCMRICCGPARGFMIHIVDNTNQEVMRVIRNFKCCAGCCWCIACLDHCAFNITVEAPVGTPVGHVVQSCSPWAPKYKVFNADMEPVLDIEGPCCPCQCVCGCTQDVNFRLKPLDSEEEIGAISKQWGGWLKETYSQADTFGLKYPKDLDVKVKATLFGALFLIDFMYYEQKKNNNN